MKNMYYTPSGKIEALKNALRICMVQRAKTYKNRKRKLLLDGNLIFFSRRIQFFVTIYLLFLYSHTKCQLMNREQVDSLRTNSSS